MAIWRKSLQGLQAASRRHEGSPDHDRPWPSKAEHYGKPEIANDVVDLPTESKLLTEYYLIEH